ncbi:MAG: ABC transporter permease [Spirochaetales bacterium]|nr:MAG: ABC transporter permease [Spirochaetales bacterium]
MGQQASAEKENKKSPFGEKFLELFVYGKSMVPALIMLLTILVVVFSVSTPYFFSFTNFKAIISNIPVMAIMAIGMTFVLLIGGLDLSVGSILGFTIVAAVLFHGMRFPAWLVVIASLATGASLGAVNGLIITRLGINPVITTLGMMAFARGLASWFSLEIKILKTGRIYDQNFLLIARKWFPDSPQVIPVTLIYLVVLYVLISMALKYTRFGRRIYATGSNEYAAQLAGVNIRRVKFMTYMISGITASMAGVILLAQLGLGRDDAGTGAELEVITAVVLGGVSLSGGKGNLLGVIIAVLILGVIRNGMVHLETVTDISYYWREVVKGAVLIIAIVIDAARTMAATKNR